MNFVDYQYLIKNKVRILFLILISQLFFLPLINGQEKSEIDLWVTPDGWRKEAFSFPMAFAKEVNFDGVADVRFTDGWGDPDSANFWSYIFAWNISLEEELSESDLENYMQLYLDGLMNVVKKDKSFNVPATTAVFTSFESKDLLNYKGKIRVYDAFFKNEMISLNVQGHYTYCNAQDKSIYLFRLSPQKVGSIVWEHINRPTLRNDICQ